MNIIKRRLPISLVILTYNEELNLGDCLESVKDYVEDIFVIDSMSTDVTLEVAGRYTKHVYTHEFKNQAEQFNWSLDNLPIESEWILKLDADERMTETLWHEIDETLPKADSAVNGFLIKRRFYFLGSWIRFGGYYPVRLLRLFRRTKGASEEREMDEHLVIFEGETRRLQNDFIHDDHKSMSDWIDKHNKYATREARQYLKEERGGSTFIKGSPGEEAEKKRFIKNRVYYRLPIFFRVFVFFFYRYIFKLGFLDGVPGLAYHFLQGFCYRWLVDVKIFEAKIDGVRVKK